MEIQLWRVTGGEREKFACFTCDTDKSEHLVVVDPSAATQVNSLDRLMKSAGEHSANYGLIMKIDTGSTKSCF